VLAKRRGSKRSQSIALPTVVLSPMAARAFSRETLERWQLAELSDDVLLVVDELVTNAVLHAHGPITLLLDLQGQEVRVEVTDNSPRLPSANPPSESGTSGRGLAIVAAISREWGTRPLASGGKLVWARVGRTDAAHSVVAR
jgi:anti-sigma regulatory factor (Ser/Thr protein kinase)